jgi:AraC family transcriptional regulator, regulatory protein of adaptative response / methylated-DNA-[protein]-cysteine methyltransferase
MMLLPPVDEMYRALVERDASFDGLFFACVRTTGIFCRPTCPARKPKPENVDFASSVEDALRRGYRPCLVCKPVVPPGAERSWLAPLLEAISSGDGPRLHDADLRERGLDPVQVRRTFKRQFGMTFQAYQRACRLGLARRALHEGAPAMDAGLDAGFESDSGFREAFHRAFGTTPVQARTAAPLVASLIETPLGPMVAVGGDEGLELLEFLDRRALASELERMRSRMGRDIVPGEHPLLLAVAVQLREYFEGRRTTFAVPLQMRGSDFQLRVWRALCDIPFAETRSYADIARAVGAPGAVRAVGTTNGRNQIAIVVPCHRVIASDGSLSGYGGGRWRKGWLLDHERSVRDRLAQAAARPA